MYSVFAMFKLSLLRESYFLTFLRSTLVLSSASPSVLPTATRFVSSANILGVVISMQFGRSLISIRNRTGPSILPRGIAHITSLRSENKPSADTFAFGFLDNHA